MPIYIENRKAYTEILLVTLQDFLHDRHYCAIGALISFATKCSILYIFVDIFCKVVYKVTCCRCAVWGKWITIWMKFIFYIVVLMQKGCNYIIVTWCCHNHFAWTNYAYCSFCYVIFKSHLQFKNYRKQRK